MKNIDQQNIIDILRVKIMVAKDKKDYMALVELQEDLEKQLYKNKIRYWIKKRKSFHQDSK